VQSEEHIAPTVSSSVADDNSNGQWMNRTNRSTVMMKKHVPREPWEFMVLDVSSQQILAVS
jgi:hypothetical protein